jgi:hypothetical protein
MLSGFTGIRGCSTPLDIQSYISHNFGDQIVRNIGWYDGMQRIEMRLYSRKWDGITWETVFIRNVLFWLRTDPPTTYPVLYHQRAIKKKQKKEMFFLLTQNDIIW